MVIIHLNLSVFHTEMKQPHIQKETVDGKLFHCSDISTESV